MHKTTLVFVSDKSATLSAFGVITITSDQSRDPKVLIEKFKAGITEWINTTGDGKEVWNYSGGDLNIGDVAGYEHDESLAACLSAHGVQFEVEVLNDVGHTLPYNTQLVNEQAVIICEE